MNPINVIVGVVIVVAATMTISTYRKSGIAGITLGTILITAGVM